MTELAATAAKPIPHLVTVKEAAQILGLKPMLLYRYIWSKKGPRVVRFGRLVRIRYDDLLKWAQPGKDHPSVSANAKKAHRKCS